MLSTQLVFQATVLKVAFVVDACFGLHGDAVNLEVLRGGWKFPELSKGYDARISLTEDGGFALGFWFAPAQDQPAVYNPLVLAQASLYCRITFGGLEKEY